MTARPSANGPIDSSQEPRASRSWSRWSRKGLATTFLVALAVLGPAMAYAGITIVYPESTITADVDESPPITFAAGGDHASLSNAGLAGSFANVNNAGGFTLTLNGLSGGNVTVDDLVNVSAESAVASYKFQVASALSGITPDFFVLRFYTGATPPTSDGDAQVCAVLDLTAAQGTETSGSCSSSVDVQVIYQLPDGQTTESGSVQVRPSSITLS